MHSIAEYIRLSWDLYVCSIAEQMNKNTWPSIINHVLFDMTLCSVLNPYPKETKIISRVAEQSRCGD